MKPTNLKVGQRWICTYDRSYFDVVEINGDIKLRWNGSFTTLYDPFGRFTYDYILDETSAVQCLLKEYETD